MKRIPLHDLLILSDSGVWGDEDPENGVSVLRSTNFSSDGWLSFNKLTFRAIDPKKRKTKLLSEGDILLEKSGGGPQQPVGRVCLFKGHSQPQSFGNFIARLRPAASVLSEYLFYFLWQFHATGRTSHYQKQTTGIRNLEFKRYLTIDVPIPPLPEQRRIVDILSRAEGIVRLQREAQKKAAEIIPALFLDMFGDPATNPKGWPTALVGDVIAAADYGSSTKASDYGAGVPLIRMGNVDYSGYLKLDDLKHVELSPEDIKKFGLGEGDIIFNRTNSKELVGKTGIWDGSREAVAASYFIRVRVERNRIIPLYFWAFMNSTYMKRVLFDTARGAIGQANINARELRAFEIMVSPLNMQILFERHIRDVFSIQSQQITALQKAEATFDALLANSFSPL
ncbi:type I restriction enzyme, S subunit [Gammaproteobacteria bacterium]